MDDISENIDSLRRQVTPKKATWSLPYWENERNVIPESYWNEEERRAAVIAKIKYVAPVNPAKIEQFASAAMGVPCKVVENIGKNTFRIIINGWSESFPRLKQVINEAKPAHLIWNVHAEIPPIIFIERSGGMFEKNLRFKTFVNYWSCYCFDEKRRFDGSIDYFSKRGGKSIKPLYYGTLFFSSFRLKNKENISLYEICRMNAIEKQSFSFRRFNFLIHYRESTGSGGLRLSAGIFSVTDAFEKISSKLHWRVKTPRRYLIFSPVYLNIQTKISHFISKIKIQKLLL